MWHTKSFYLGALLGLCLWGCGSGKFAANSSQSKLYNIEVEDSTLPPGKDSLDAMDAGSGNESAQRSDSTREAESKEDKSQCAASLEARQDLIRVTGSQQNMTIESATSILSRITGNLNELTINLHSKSPATLVTGLCLFIAGHENQAHINIHVPIGALHIKARGDQALVHLTLEKGGKIEKINWDAKGNQPQLVIKGAAESYPCPQSGGKSRVICQ